MGTVFDKTSAILQNLNKGVSPATLGRWKKLSYKYWNLLKDYERNQAIGDVMNPPFMQIPIATNNAAAEPVDAKKKQ